mmetsp:Transcript_12130/g.48846  ORF Transcript_12130/g.48846 Transcript_12130/m.48846 type:complete len:212 (-) Transcript_12130:641-1276(-)
MREATMTWRSATSTEVDQPPATSVPSATSTPSSSHARTSHCARPTTKLDVGHVTTPAPPVRTSPRSAASQWQQCAKYALRWSRPATRYTSAYPLAPGNSKRTHSHSARFSLRCVCTGRSRVALSAPSRARSRAEHDGANRGMTVGVTSGGAGRPWGPSSSGRGAAGGAALALALALAWALALASAFASLRSRTARQNVSAASAAASAEAST